MNKIKNRLRGLFNKYTILLLFTYFVFGIGFSYAYFAYSYQNTTTIVGNVIAINATLNVELVVGNNGKMVPMQNNALSNALNNVGGTSACVDSNGNLSCQVYKITLNNTGSRLQHITGTIELYAKDGTGNVYNNLRWQELTSPTVVKTDSNVNRMGKSLLASDITMNTGDTLEWYIAVWISEMDYDQTNTDKGQFGGTVTFEALELSDNFSNAPNLDNGNLLPVYYDDTVQADDGTYGVWKKADSANTDNSWYNYSNKMWANAVIVDPNSTTDYTQIDVDDPIPESDIIAFYVWIPRYKYRVWNLNRQAYRDYYPPFPAFSYAYPAYENGIDIEFEYFEGNTGNVECVYDTVTVESETNLSDKCYYNGSRTPITTTDLNPDDAWYTHPAFTFGGEEIEGFWIGKFETSGEVDSNNIAQTPTILPDVSSLRNQYLAQQFTTSRKFQNYLSSETDAHMLTNLEWGAVAYLTHSIYGLCDGISCSGVNHNNSNDYFTGRSGGNIVGNISQEKVFYSNDSLTANQNNTNGYYNYKGYKLDSTTGEPITKELVSLVASTTKNVTGVYDMSGGASEYVMGNMVDTSNNFYSSSAVSSDVTNPWNGSSTLDTKFYNSYSNGSTSSDRKAFNRARLGDATAEVLGGISWNSAWKPGSGETGSYSYFMYDSYSWFSRGGNFYDTYAGVFSFGGNYGSSVVSYSFRSSLS